MVHSLKTLPQANLIPDHVEYCPPRKLGPSKMIIDVEKYAGMEERPAILWDWTRDIGSLLLNFTYATNLDFFALIRYKDTVCDFLTGSVDLDYIKKKGFKRVTFEPALRTATKLIADGMDEDAIAFLDKMMIELEAINEYDIRSRMCCMKALLHRKNGRSLLAAIYYMESASILSSSKKFQSLDENNQIVKVNQSAKLYYLSLLCLSSHVKANGVDGNYDHWFADLAARAAALFERQAERSEGIFNFNKKGEIRLGKYAIPYGVAGKDETSADYNRYLALEAQRLNQLNQKRNELSHLKTYLKGGQYKKEELETLFVVVEQIEKDQNPDLEDVLAFYDFMLTLVRKSESYSSVAESLEIIKIKTLARYKKATEEDLLRVFKYLDNSRENESSFRNLIYLADQLSTITNQDLRLEFAAIVLDKNYPHLPLSLKEAYLKIKDHGFIAVDERLNAFYPATFIAFKLSMEKLLPGNNEVLYQGEIKTISYEELVSLLVMRAKQKFPLENFVNFQHIVTDVHSKKNMIVIKTQEPHKTESLLNKLLKDLPLESHLGYLKERIRIKNSRVGVFGLTKVGKSTFLNSLLERELLKSDRGIATNVITLIHKSNSERAVVHFEKNDSKEITINEIGKYTSEQGNPENKLGVLNAEIFLNSNTPENLVLIDVPGFGAAGTVFELHEEVIEGALNVVDAVFLVTTPSDGLKSFELEFIKKITLSRKLPFILIANKMDGLEEHEKVDLINGLKERLKENDIPFDSFNIISVSSQLGLSFIPGISENRLLGFSIGEAQTESGFIEVKASLSEIEQKVSSLKDQTIINKIISELDIFRENQELFIQDIKKVQIGSVGEINSEIIFMKEQMSFLQKVATDLSSSMSASIERVGALSCKTMSEQVILRATVQNGMSLKEDEEMLYKKGHEVFLEHKGLVVKDIETSFTDARAAVDVTLRKIAPFIGELSLNTSLERSHAQSENQDGMLEAFVHKLKKYIQPRHTFQEKSFKILEHIKKEEVKSLSLVSQQILKHISYVEGLILERVIQKSDMLSYKNTDYKDKIDLAQRYVKLCLDYREKAKI